MISLKIYSFIRKIDSARFDYSCIRNIINTLKEKEYDVEWENLDGDDKFIYKNDCEVTINQGSISIYEFKDTKKFKILDFGDAPTLSVKLSKSKNFIGAAIGQYNETLWNETVKDTELRKHINPSPYFEMFWQFGMENYNDIQEYRNSITLDDRLLWRGSMYENPNPYGYKIREWVRILSSIMGDRMCFGYFPIMYDDYIKETINSKLVLCAGGGGGYICGDHCLRDIELYGLGIPTIRPKYVTKNFDPLIPDFHYISVDVEVDEKFRYINQETLARRTYEKYNKVINDNDFLNYIAKNSREWYIKNMSYPNVVNNIIESLEL